ncbi:MAG: excinuclease ABC subunit UvrC [Lachnospiraceae bacterium]|nr:excinuclease ABC subunit UvrC [Lachnospiraceae bacterium]
MSFSIKDELKKLPDAPGVYLMHDEEGRILYVGKATSLKNRVKSYFAKTVNRGPQIIKMIGEIAWFETITVSSETEALILECNLIKEHRPPYNTLLMDDKTYPYVCLTSETYPRVFLSRRLKRDKNEYFGPFTNVTAVREAVRLMETIFRLRTCSRRLPEDQGKERPCLQYQMGRCPAPCLKDGISPEEYGVSVEKARRFLKGDYRPALAYLKEKMQEAAERLDFEEAARYRDLMQDVKVLAEKQKISEAGGEDRDILALAVKDGEGIAEIFFIRNGRMIGRDHSRIEVMEEEPAALLSQVIRQFYSGTPFLPREILVETEPEDRELLEAVLSSRAGRKVTVRVPQRGEKRGLLDLAAENAVRELERLQTQAKREEERSVGALKGLQELLGMTELRRIEAYDISHISGFATVGSMVVYEDGRPKKNDYRKFRIRFVEGNNDTASLTEVLFRRFTHGLKEQGMVRESIGYDAADSFLRFPDLILMDGGKGQVHAALEVLARLGLRVPVCGMVKDDRHRTRGLYFEDRELPIDTKSEIFKLITRIQDETHRFAIEYHRSLRGKSQVHSILDDIPGVGPARRRALLAALPDIDSIRTADYASLKAVPGMNAPSARAVYAFFHGGEVPET